MDKNTDDKGREPKGKKLMDDNVLYCLQCSRTSNKGLRIIQNENGKAEVFCSSCGITSIFYGESEECKDCGTRTYYLVHAINETHDIIQCSFCKRVYSVAKRHIEGGIK